MYCRGGEKESQVGTIKTFLFGLLHNSLGKTSKLIGCSIHIQQPAAANLYRKCYTSLLKAAAYWLQPAVMNVDVFPYDSAQRYEKFHLCICVSRSYDCNFNDKISFLCKPIHNCSWKSRNTIIHKECFFFIICKLSCNGPSIYHGQYYL